MMQNPETKQDLKINAVCRHVVVTMNNVQCRNRRFGCITYNDDANILENVPPENVTFEASSNTLKIVTNKLGVISAYEAEPKGKI